MTTCQSNSRKEGVVKITTCQSNSRKAWLRSHENVEQGWSKIFGLDPMRTLGQPSLKIFGLDPMRNVEQGWPKIFGLDPMRILGKDSRDIWLRSYENVG